MSALGAALGLAAPALGASVASAFAAMGAAAVFAPGCLGAGGRPAVTTAVMFRDRPASLIAIVDTAFRVSEVHVARAPTYGDEHACQSELFKLAGPGPVERHWSGPDLVLGRPARSIAGAPSRYLAIYRASLGRCLAMLSIGGLGDL